MLHRASPFLLALFLTSVYVRQGFINLFWLLADVGKDTAVYIQHMSVNGIRSL